MSVRFRRLLTRAILAGLFVLPALIGRPCHAQVEFSNLPPPGVPVFDLDWATYRQGNDSIRVECYYRITNPRLSYVRRAMKPGEAGEMPSGDSAATKEYYVAAYEITAILSSSRDKQAATVSARENYALATFDETRNPSGYLINILSAVVTPDDFEMSVTLSDRVSGNSYALDRQLALRELRGSDWAIGGPLFFDPSAEAPSAQTFQRHGRGLVPNVTRSFTGSKDRVAVLFEAYRFVAPGARYLVIDIDQRFGKQQRVDTLVVADTGQTVAVIYRNQLTGFETGEAMIKVRLKNDAGKSVGDPLEIPFWIDWSMSGMVEENWEEAVDMLVHIATHDELKSLRGTPSANRREAFASFWKSKDPSPGTDENEWEEEYYRRIRHADLHFTNAIRRGWRSDFGTVYVKYGEPDEVERHPFEPGSKPYQLWYYYAQRRRFVFIDVTGNGDYELQYPYDGITRGRQLIEQPRER